MRRRLLQFACRLSLLMCAATACMWDRSFFVHNAWPTLLRHSGFQLQSCDGRLILVHATLVTAASFTMHFDVDYDDVLRSNVLFTGGGRGAILPAGGLSNAFGFSRAEISYPASHGYQVKTSVRASFLVIPYWAVVLGCLIVPVIYRWTTPYHRKRIATGLCPACGYDLRATPDRCPECGAIADASVVVFKNRKPSAAAVQ